jgi:hypothetical protein
MLDDRTSLRDDLSREKYYIWNNANNRGGSARPPQSQRPLEEVSEKGTHYTNSCA